MSGFFVQQDTQCRWNFANGTVLSFVEGTVVYEEHNGEISRHFVQGQNLESFMRTTKCTIASFVRLLQQAVSSLRRVHEKGYTHGNVHARNLIIDAHTMNVLWVDLENSATQESDMDSFRKMCMDVLSDSLEHKIFRAHLCAHTDIVRFLHEWNTEQWDRGIIAEMLFRDKEPSPVLPSAPVKRPESKPLHIDAEECAVWEELISKGLTGENLALQFFASFPPKFSDPSLLQCIAEGILLHRLSKSTVLLYEQQFGAGQNELIDLLALAERAVEAAQKVEDLEERIDQKEGLSWYERTFGAAKEELAQLRIDFAAAVQEREQILPKLIPMARGLLDHSLATKVAQKKKAKLEEAMSKEHTWKEWFPSRVYAPPKPIPLQKCVQTIEVDGEKLEFRLLPTGIDKEGQILDQPLWVSVHLIHQDVFQRVMNTNPSRHLGGLLPVHMVSYETALRFCNVLSKKCNKEEQYGFTGGEWYIASEKGFRLLSESEWLYAAQAQSDTPENILDYAWCCENSNNMPHVIGKKRPNAWGLHDMWGGMEEWVWSNTVHSSKRIGGSWYHDTLSLMSMPVHEGAENLSADTIGFRIAFVADLGEDIG